MSIKRRGKLSQYNKRQSLSTSLASNGTKAADPSLANGVQITLLVASNMYAIIPFRRSHDMTYLK